MRHLYPFLALVLLAVPPSAQTLVPDDDVDGVLVEQGYNLRLAVDGLTFPSNLTAGDGDDDGRIWISESGYSPDGPPAVLEITVPASGTGTASVILTPAMLSLGQALPPFTSVAYDDGALYLGHRQADGDGNVVGAYSRFDPDDPAGTFETVLSGLSSTGDHSNNTIVFGTDGRAYFGQGSATNTGVVGPDNGWVEGAPDFREIAPVEIVLNGVEFTARVPSNPDPEADAVTAPYRPFDSGPIEAGFTVAPATPDAPIAGTIVGSGTVYSFDPDAADPVSTLRLEAWGLRNPFGLAFDADDPTRLFVSNNGSDIRGQAGDPDDPLDPTTFIVQGSRPVHGDEDDVFVLTVDGDAEFFGWPEFFHDPETRQPVLASDARFCDSPALTSADCAGPIFDEAFRNSLTVEPVFASVGLYVSTTGLTPSTSAAFGYEGQLFTTESGSFSPQTGAFEFTGYRVTRIDADTGAEVDFLVNEGSTTEELFVPEKMNKPVATAFVGDRLFIVDLGVLEPGVDLFQSGTGKVWVVDNLNATDGESGTDTPDFALDPVWPNPATEQARVAFRLAAPADVRVGVFDVLGRETAVLHDGPLGTGPHEAVAAIGGLAPGVYVVRVEADGAALTRRFTVLR